MSKWKCGICNSEFDNYQAQGFNGIIYCPLCYFKELYKREKTKNDKAIEIEKIRKLQSEVDLLGNEIGKYHNIIHSMRDRNNYMKEKLKELQCFVGDSNE